IATMADMDIADRIKILKMVNNVLKGKKKKSTHNEPKQAGRVRKKPPLIPCLPPHIATSM
ncbi:MAG: hypothetical protein GWN86_20645, partial [Desulfobacterales bacterium]|nr:hypothetical protein [Desulfobacterales bacterium]